MSMHEN